MIVNVRGTGGSGKSTVVRRIMELYPEKKPIHVEGRRQPYYYQLSHPTHERRLTVPGHYETPTGGCDTLKTVDEVYAILQRSHEFGYDAIFEGIISQDDITRAIAMANRIGRENFHVILLNTSVEESLKGIQARRDARGDTKPLNPENTISRAKRAKQRCASLKDAGVNVHTLDREAAFLKAKELLGWPS